MEKIADPFQGFRISSHQPLEGLKRSKCPKCKSSRMYFCYTCYKYVEGVDQILLPKVKLPFSVDIIKHPKELDGKSTAVHASLLAPDDVCIYTYPIIPTYSNQTDDILLVFPGPDAHPIKHFSKCKDEMSLKRKSTTSDYLNEAPSAKLKCNDVKDLHGNTNSVRHKGNDECASENHNGNGIPTLEPTFKKIVMIDSTWNQVHAISNDERLKGIPSVELTEQKTLYWRRQHNSPDTHLATVEALHSFLRQYHEIFVGKYDNRYDDLLYFFKFFHTMVHKNKALKQKEK